MSVFDLSAFKLRPQADDRFVVRGDRYRITVLTDRMLRLEYSADGVFEDRATRRVFDRAFDTPAFETYREGDRLWITTKHLRLCYDEKPFSENGLSVTVDGNKDWYYGREADNLGGTVRTLDNVSGAIPLGKGLCSRNRGFAVFDDSVTIAIGEDGWCVPVGGDRIDLYFFGYSHDYVGCIRDFYKLSAPVPLLPRTALGNWWSRYHAYTQEEYLALMDKFEEKGVPLAVSVIDMDWHITKMPDPVRYGSGWTGFTWERSLFPDHRAFLRNLRERGLKISLNLHPHDGVRDFEEAYPAICAALGKEADGKPVEFDVSDRAFMEAYFDKVLHPLEEEGVDFWWIDWQQQGGTKVAGYDPLWMLNHAHYTDNCRDDRRGLLFSRYADIGSHRYPLGFSGDTHITWESLEFQPYFTATAANVGYAWWSHDIGGHMLGVRDDELYTRWVQLGVVSPILRLHSSPNPFSSKEPWNYGEKEERIAKEYLRLRHKLIPYIYTEMVKNHTDGIPMIRPLYHDYPNEGGAYNCPSAFFFGSECIAAPIGKKCDPASGLAPVKVWLPKGKWIDLFTGRIYDGGRALTAYRDLERFPLFVKAGAILPMDGTDALRADTLPGTVELHIFGGADGAYTMIEDDDKPEATVTFGNTEFAFSFGETSTLTVRSPAQADFLPRVRDYRVVFYALTKPSAVRIGEKALAFTYDPQKNTATTEAFSLPAGESVTVTVEGAALAENELRETVYALLKQSTGISIGVLRQLCDIVGGNASLVRKIAAVGEVNAPRDILAAVTELLTAE